MAFDNEPPDGGDPSDPDLTPQRRRLARDIFLEALELDADRRSFYLDQVCGQDSRLRSEVESLLREAETVVFDAKTLTVSGFRCTDVVGLNARFRILRWIGTGGMGEVYEADDLELQKSIAIKTIRPEIAARPEMIARFKREIQIAQEVTHSNVCRVYDLGQHRTRSSGEGEPPTLFMTMEMIGNAKTLSALMREHSPMPVQDVIRIGQQIASGVEALHAAGYIHRDLKPSNIMVSNADSVRKCRAVVTDLGLARSILDGHTIAAPGLKRSGRSGTPEYMAPEQIEGGPLSEATDIYSLGVIFYQMSTGVLPRKRHGSDVLEPPHSDTALPKLPGGFARILQKCMATDPVDRFAKVEELNAALERMNDQPSRKASLRRPNLWTRAAEGLGLALVVLFGALVYLKLSPPPPTRAHPVTSFRGEEVFPSLSPDGNYVAYSWTGDHEDNEDIYIKLIGEGGTGTRRTTDAARDFSPSWSPDNRWIAYLHSVSNDEAELRLMPPLGGVEHPVARVRVNSGRDSGSTADRELPVPYLAWTPDGKYLAVPVHQPGGPSSIWLYPTESGEPIRLTFTAGVRGGDSSPVFAPDGKLMAFTRTTSLGSSDVYLLDLTTDLKPAGQPRRLTFKNRPIHGMAWGPQRTILFTMDEEGVWEIKAADNAKPEKLSVGTSMNDLAYSPVAHRLVYSRAGYDWNIWRMPLRDPGPERHPKPFISNTVLEENPQYSPDGKKIAFESNGSGLMEIWLCDADGSNPTQLTKFAGSPVGTPRWSPDGQWIAFDHNEGGFWGIYVVRAKGGGPRRVTPAPSKRQETYEAPSWSRDGKWIYYGSNQTGNFEVWKLPFAGGTPVQVTRQGGFVPFESTDGSRLYYTKGEGGGIFEMTLADGKEVKIVNAIFSRNFTVTDRAVYFIPFAKPGKIVIRALDLATRKIRDVGPISAKPLEGMSVSPDGEFLLYTQLDSYGSDLIAVENVQ